MDEQVESRLSREWTKFVILAAILIGAILVVVLIRPFIFNHVVPAVMGEGQSSTSVPTETEPPSPESPAEEVEPAPPTEEEPAPAETDESMPGEEKEEGEVSATAVPDALRTHIIQPGETLYQIARSYNVAVDAIVAANKLPNPSHIEAGQPLIIPQP
ncbi:MAG: LysM peptidoglycan-binding domain-containing protein [Chloroflexi bacterium]|nr:LysM peptidoglycan-binding domain-containing protein [Chloroflexota bacterium]